MAAVIYKDSDQVIQVTVTDGTDPIDLTSCDDITVTVYQTKDDIIQQWKLSDSTVQIVNAADGICKVNLDRDNTKNIPARRLYIQVDLQFINAEFEDGIMIMKNDNADVVLCDLKDSAT